jgi:putative membrane protein
MLLDWALASLLHLAIFSLAGIIAFELALTARALDDTAILRLARVDTRYGAVAAIVLAVGAARVMLGAKGAYYMVNAFFWTKMGLFVAVGLLSIAPTLRFLAWRRRLRTDASFRPDAAALLSVRRALWAEVLLFAGIPVAAAAMARGYGM